MSRSYHSALCSCGWTIGREGGLPGRVGGWWVDVRYRVHRWRCRQ